LPLFKAQSQTSSRHRERCIDVTLQRPLGRYAAAGCAEVVFDLFPRDSTDGMLESLERFHRDIRPLLK